MEDEREKCAHKLSVFDGYKELVLMKSSMMILSMRLVWKLMRCILMKQFLSVEE